MSEAPQRNLLEILATLLLALAAVATAWSSYQATRWNGEQAKAASRTNAIRIDAARASSLAEAEPGGTADPVRHAGVPGGRAGGGRPARPIRRTVVGDCPSQHPTGEQLRPGRGALRRGALLRGHEQQTPGARLRIAMVAIGCAVFIGALSWIAAFPVSVSV